MRDKTGRKSVKNRDTDLPLDEPSSPIRYNRVQSSNIHPSSPFPSPAPPARIGGVFIARTRRPDVSHDGNNSNSSRVVPLVFHEAERAIDERNETSTVSRRRSVHRDARSTPSRSSRAVTLRDSSLLDSSTRSMPRRANKRRVLHRFSSTSSDRSRPIAERVRKCSKRRKIAPLFRVVYPCHFR